MVLNENIKAFVTNISSLDRKMSINLATKGWTSLFLVAKVTILVEYLGFVDMFQKN